MTCDDFDEAWLELVDADGESPHGPTEATLDLARMHAKGCQRCGEKLAELQDLVERFEFDLDDVPHGLADEIIRTAREEEEALKPKWLRTLDRLISVGGRYAMRPQLAMGLLLVLMLGVSLVWLRPRGPDPNAVRVTERGVPANTDDPRTKSGARVAASAAGPSKPSPAARRANKLSAAARSARAEADALFGAAMEHYRKKRFAEAERGFTIVATGGGPQADRAGLYAARSVRFRSGCGAALPLFQRLAGRYAGTPVASQATWDAAVCARSLGSKEQAKQLFSALVRSPGFESRAKAELAKLRGEPSPDASAPKPAKAATPKEKRK